MFLLARSPPIQRAVREEVVAVLGGRAPEPEDLPRLDLLTRVIQESLRLYPPGWILTRQSLEDDELGGYHVPARSLVFASEYALHRDPRFWEDPEGFDPDHFLPERAKARPHYAYLPFGGGPHQCIGASFAMTEMQVVLAMVLRAYHLELVPGAKVEPQPLFTLRPNPGVPLVLHPYPGA
jgi:cytochrome P450